MASEGWGARLLDLQTGDGQWGGGSYTPKWISTTYTLLLLRHLGIDPGDRRVRSAVDLVRDRVTLGQRNWPFFEYRTEICVTAMALALGSYFLISGRSAPARFHPGAPAGRRWLELSCWLGQVLVPYHDLSARSPARA